MKIEDQLHRARRESSVGGVPLLFRRDSASLKTPGNPHIAANMAYLPLRRIAILLAFAAVCVYAEKHASIASMSIPEIEDKLQVNDVPRCSPSRRGRPCSL